MKYIPYWFILGACVILGSRFNRGSARLLDRECGLSPIRSRITGGQAAIEHSTPWMAFLHNNTDFICGGSLIAKAFVLTAAHCVTPTPSFLLARLGEYDWSPHKPCLVRSGCIQSERDYKVSDIHKPPRYKTGVNDDIAILKLEQEVHYTANIRPICVLLKDFLDEWQQYLIKQKNLIMTGWGGTKNSTISFVLQTANLTQVDRKTCRDKYNYPVDESHICAGDIQQYACPGDSGSPLGLMVPDTDYYIQLGIVSNGRIPCQGVSVFTNVLSYSNWIAEVTTKNNRNKTISTRKPPSSLLRNSFLKQNMTSTNVLSNSEWIAEVTTKKNRNKVITTPTPRVVTKAKLNRSSTFPRWQTQANYTRRRFQFQHD